MRAHLNQKRWSVDQQRRARENFVPDNKNELEKLIAVAQMMESFPQMVEQLKAVNERISYLREGQRQ